MISISDFENWKADQVTKAFFDACQERVYDTKDLLSMSAGLDAVNDNFNRGFIAAYQEMQEFRVEAFNE